MECVHVTPAVPLSRTLKSMPGSPPHACGRDARAQIPAEERGSTGSEADGASVDRTLVPVLVRRGRVVDAEIEAAQAACRREKSSLASRAAGRRAAEGSDSAGMP